MKIVTCVVLTMIALPMGAWAQEHDRASREYFESKVRPILVEHCYECHSATTEEPEAGLRLDSRAGWSHGGDSGPAIVPGKPDASLLIRAIRYDDTELTGMPPDSRLSDQQIAILENWVANGAFDPRSDVSSQPTTAAEDFDLSQRRAEHWCWQPITQPEPPPVERKDWPINAIDQFILAKLEHHGLVPASDADQGLWLRRVYFDLIGLPPTPQQIEQFRADRSPESYERVVDELLDSPRFGEKWARHWMDLVRYAETYGHEFDYEIRFAFEYRDYLIRAFNADVPYDQLVREHIAGDLLTSPRRHPTEQFNESVIGTGFWFLHEAFHGPTDVLANESDIMANQIDVFGKTFLGLTIACARCHDHKFDAISTKDYYALTSYLHSSCRQDVPLDTRLQFESSAEAVRELRQQAAEQLRDLDDDAIDAIREAVASEPPSPRSVVEWNQGSSTCYADFSSGEIPEGWSTSGNAFEAVDHGLTIGVDGKLARPATIDSGLSGAGQVGILRTPTFEITHPQIHVLTKSTGPFTMRLVIDNYQMAIPNSLLFRGTFVNDKASHTNGKWSWLSLRNDLDKYVGHRAYLEFIDEGKSTVAIDEIWFSSGGVPSASEQKNASEPSADAVLADIRAGVSNECVRRLISEERISLRQLSAEAADAVESAAAIAGRIPNPRFAIAMAQGTPEEGRVYLRGKSSSQGDPVPGRMLEALDGQPASRLGLASQIASAENPLAARVIVNRIWHHLLGRGIVATVDDFGPQGETPTHPELLDWLATDLVQHDWSLKHAMRQIVLSRTYRQSSVADADPSTVANRDPNNKLLHRMPVRRLPGEAIRDAILTVAGTIDLRPFGPSVPTHRTPFMTGRGARKSGPLDGDGRRSVYLAVYRNFLNPFMATFDTPTPFGPQGRRSQSNVPAQALALMNDPFVRDQASAWVDRLLADESMDDRSRVESMVIAAHATRPTTEQVAVMLRFLDDQSGIYGTRDRRCWEDLAHAIWNMKAFYWLY